MAVETPFPLKYKRQDPEPIDVDSVFTTTAARNTYLTNPLRYGGQIVSDLETGKAYILNTAKTAWVEMGSGGGGGGETILPATLIETKAEVGTGKYISPFTLGGWFAFILTQAKEITGIWTFNAGTVFKSLIKFDWFSSVDAAGEILEVNTQKEIVKAVKKTAYNKNFGTGSDDVAQGSALNTVADNLSTVTGYLTTLSGKFPAQTAGDTGKVLVATGTGPYTLQPNTVSAGGTTEGALQFRSSAGLVTGTDLLAWQAGTRTLQLGSVANPGKFEVIASESVIEAIDGQALSVLVNNNLDTAFEIKDKVTQKIFLLARTKIGNEAIVGVENFDVDALIGAPLKMRQGKVVTTSEAKTYLKMPNSVNDIVISMPFNGNALVLSGHLLGVTDTGSEAIHIKFESKFRRFSNVIYKDNADAVTVDSTVSQGATAGCEANGTNDGVKIFVTPASSAIAKTYTWYLYDLYMKV
jgi:hypothetical protein